MALVKIRRARREEEDAATVERVPDRGGWTTHEDVPRRTDRRGVPLGAGPGQLVAYPIVRLAGVFPIPGHPAHGDVIRYLRALEHAVIETAAAYGVAAERRPPHTGVWHGPSKLASIGVKVAGGVTLQNYNTAAGLTTPPDGSTTSYGSNGRPVARNAPA